jgi:hypothetical protein
MEERIILLHKVMPSFRANPTVIGGNAAENREVLSAAKFISKRFSPPVWAGTTIEMTI